MRPSKTHRMVSKNNETLSFWECRRGRTVYLMNLLVNIYESLNKL